MTNKEYAEKLIKDIEEFAPKSRGKTLMIKFLKGERLSPSQAMKAQCFCCNGYYIDGLEDCEDHTCPIYPYMPYKNKKGKK